MELEDALRPSPEKSRAVYEKGFCMWVKLHTRAQQEFSLPKFCFYLQPAVSNLPPLVKDLDLKYQYNGLYATGTSTWETSRGQCKIPPVQKTLELLVSKNRSTRLALSERLKPTYHKWFEQKENHLAVLIPAWSYIFSARWAELMPGAELNYTEKHAKYDNNERDERTEVMVDVGDVDDNAARWWAAILASGEGWQAGLTLEQTRFRSPWSTALEPDTKFTICYRKPLHHASATAPSSTAALRFLAEYCELHNIADQTIAALSSTLFLPSLYSNPVSLPTPNFYEKPRPKLPISGPIEPKQSGIILEQIAPILDRLMTLSCNTRGLHSLLSSVFYEPGIPCNAASPWLQSTFAVLDTVKDDILLAHILMNRVPQVSFLWLGAIIVGTQKEILEPGRFGLTMIDLHAAAWCGVKQSFMQEPLTQPLVTNGALLRSDECRLLFLIQGGLHSRWPLCPWMPFGSTALEDAEIEVRLHSQCTGHGLQYAGWHWACRNGRVVHPLCESLTLTAHSPARHLALSTPIAYEALNLEEETASENATRMIFSWLRYDGYPPRERKISNHEWMNLDDSEDESPLLNESPKSHEAASSKAVEEWIQRSILVSDSAVDPSEN